MSDDVSNRYMLQSQQKVAALEAIAKLRSVSYLFPPASDERSCKKYEEWNEKVDEFEDWLWKLSPIA